MFGIYEAHLQLFRIQRWDHTDLDYVLKKGLRKINFFFSAGFSSESLLRKSVS